MRAARLVAGAALALLVVVAAAGAGCRPDEEFEPLDLSSAALYCPPNPPVGTDFACDPTAIPYCTYPAQQVTCTCQVVARGRHALVCSVDLGASD
jgi:hypothetical protein